METIRGGSLPQQVSMTQQEMGIVSGLERAVKMLRTVFTWVRSRRQEGEK